MHRYDEVCSHLRANPRSWLVTGAAGFIGSNLVETLLRHDQIVVGLDNFATGHARNLDEVRTAVGPERWARFRFITGSICDLPVCREALRIGGGAVDIVLHQAALGSVPRSLADPIETNRANVDGFLNLLVAARDAKVQRFVYAASSSTYGDHPGLPKVEDVIGRPLSPYAVTKYVNELYADVFARAYGLSTIGLRYFNVFGPRQDPNGPYAAVIPKWIASLMAREPVFINGDGETSRDFCYVNNVVQANILAATAKDSAANQVYNVALGERTSLRQLFEAIRGHLSVTLPGVADAVPQFRDFRSGDVRHSLAAIDKAVTNLGYAPEIRVGAGIQRTVNWYLRHRR